MATDSKRDALIAEGLTEGEADYLLSGGSKTEGLAPPDAGTQGAEAGAQPQATPAAAAGAGDQAAATAAATTPAAAGTEDEDKDLAPNTPVPYQRFYREKQRRQEATREIQARDATLAEKDKALRELQEKWARLDERLSVFREADDAVTAQAGQAAETKPAAPPNIEDDLFGYIKWLGDTVQGVAGKTTEVETQVQQREAQQALETAYVADARTFARAQPDFGAAYDWLMRNRDAELAAAGYTDPAERMRIITLDERDIVARALTARQKNPSAPGPTAVLYGLAKARGYQVAAPAQAQQQPAAAAGGANGAAGNGHANGNGAAAADTTSLTAQVEAIQRGQAASRSLNAGGGSPAPQGIDLARLADMTDAEYAAWKRTLTPAQHAELRGMMGASR